MLELYDKKSYHSGMIKPEIIQALKSATANGCKFMSFLYRSKGTGETSKYLINFGVDYAEACRQDLATLEAYSPQDALEGEAKGIMLESLKQTVFEGVSESYTHKDTYENIGKGLKVHRETGDFHLWGFVQSKETVAEGEPKKPVNSKPITLAKRKIERACDFKRNRFAQFVLRPENIGGIRVNGEVIEFHQ